MERRCVFIEVIQDHWGWLCEIVLSGLWGVDKVRVSRDQRPGLLLHLLGRLHSDEASVEQQVVDDF